RRVLEDHDAAARETVNEAAQIIQRMNAAGTRIEHAADKNTGAGLIAYLMGVEDSNVRVSHLTLHPFGFIDRRLKRGMTMRGLDLARARQPCCRDAELRHQLLDDVDGLVCDLVHALCHGAAMRSIDVAERAA